MVPPLVARALAQPRLSAEDRALIERLQLNDLGHGYDAFGLHRDFVGFGLSITRPIYDHYFRVLSYGSEHIPKKGPVILAANHSGTIPVDGAMLWTDVLLHTERVPRAIADHFVPTLPFVGTFFARGGMVGGSRGNARSLLEAGEMLMIFPEGTVGIGKHFRDRYKLAPWRVGHAELAIRHRAQIVPIALIGPEEQMPQIGRIKGFGAVPYLPIPATPLPMPVRYRIHYGEPIPCNLDYTPEDADDPEMVKEAAKRVEEAVKGLIEKGLKMRKGRLFT